MALSEELILLSRDAEKLASLAVIPLARRSSSVPMATFRLVVVQSGGAEAMENNAASCHVPVGELRDREGAVDDVFQLLLARIRHPDLRLEVAREAMKAASHVRARCAAAAAAEEAEGKLVDIEFRLLVVPGLCQDDEEEVGSDLEFDEEAWQLGASDGEHWRNVHDGDDVGHAVALDSGAHQFTARHYQAREKEGGQAPSTEALLLRDDYEVRSDGPELSDQHELTARDVRRLVRLAVNGGDVEGDEAYKRAFHGNAPVTHASMAAMLQQALGSIKLPSPSLTPHMRTGF